MCCQAGFDHWRTTIMHHLSHLRKSQAPVLTLWSFGMVLARSCALTAGSRLLAAGMHRPAQTVRQQLRAWDDDVPRKRGAKRGAWRPVVRPCGGMVRGWRQLLRRLCPAMSQGGTVIVLAERGVDAPWLLRRITRRGWPPFWRSNTGGSFRPTGATRLRRVRLIRQGWVALLVAVRRQEPWPTGRLVPDPWPAVPSWAEEAREAQQAMPKAA